MKDRIAIIDGLRSPIAKASGKLNNVSADTLGAIITKELILRNGLDYSLFDEVILGNVAQPANAANIARVIAIRAGFPQSTPAYTVHRNCASGMQSISSAIEKIHSNQGDLYLVGGVESMSNIPLLHNDKFRNFLTRLTYSRNIGDKLHLLSSFRPSFLKPVIGLISGLTDPISGKIMGITAENLANEFKISREHQDEYALNSHLKAQKAIEDGVFKDEIHEIMTKDSSIIDDDGVRFNQTIEALFKLRPIFDRLSGTVTAGNSSQVSDGACSLIVTTESKAKELNLEPLGFISDYAYAGLDAHRMGLGPIYATKKLFDKTKTKLEEIDVIELNEAFAAQVIANLEAFKSDSFCKKTFGSSAIGEIDESILNINGGAIALGHPVGMSGSRIVLTALKELKRRKGKKALATLCIGGGQGAAFLLEV
ncbi:thiolase family protein [Poseidonibacter ostreae]|jgi:acetyl-CoA C-acetyltransferase|uniref:Acetyl-CoA C-acyltransferase n=2 Tax=Poseidonibacter ostreae TaxID=2654171 RepID=A0A6L4WNT2_9BACT|nr:thiolase family protein [Poseidonibacter ostreae]KAB7885290.1 acetyl-CoA C-acyltransferase [Poseidonibacter ostreae]KAB7891738.1 acetyl-CoA C-acyltransferase [Poseidonibacter ostreae]